MYISAFINVSMYSGTSLIRGGLVLGSAYNSDLPVSLEDYSLVDHALSTALPTATPKLEFSSCLLEGGAH